MEYVVVIFPDRREVLVDGVVQGYNRERTGALRILRVDEGLHRFRLRGPDDYIPLWLTVEVSATTATAPLAVVFARQA
jgi:hypothetical protein